MTAPFASRIHLALAVLAAGIAQPASALSCLSPTVQTSFAAADDSDATYVMGVGRLTPVPGQRIPAAPDNPNHRVGYSLEATFEGHLATRNGFDHAYAGPVTVDVTCVAAWCGQIPVGAHLLFLERTAEGDRLTAGPCPRFALPSTPRNRSDALSCLARGCVAP
ncbi:hypothetical protein [Jannaschia sp. 2305UL9-9]|uniref:hypothetical protein n=1 Tax=Jannaschia sp. 2305UL9-9 TaxID=3121638 RepID=UPI0035272847